MQLAAEEKGCKMRFSECCADIPQLTCSLVFVSGPRRRHGAQTAVASAASQSSNLSARRLTCSLSTQDGAKGGEVAAGMGGERERGKENNTKVCWRREREWDSGEGGKRVCVYVCV